MYDVVGEIVYVEGDIVGVDGDVDCVVSFIVQLQDWVWFVVFVSDSVIEFE